MTTKSHITAILRCALCLLLSSACFGALQAAGKIEFNRDIRPILSENCFYCHGPDKNHRKGKMRLDQREAALEKEAFVPGKPDKSELVSRINTTDQDDLMPPSDTHKVLTAHQKDLLKQWIAEGAEYQLHWAYIIPKRPATPIVKQTGWLKNPIDAFILERLEQNHLPPSPEADRRTLLRRLSLDLIGLPPTPEEVDAFVRDRDPKAYEKQVDRLLRSPHYGERMATPWLDAVRFSDTVGYHGDQNENNFPYRDYVINSFNRNKPFDQFTIEQLAGDLLPNPTTEQLIATGFNRLNMVTREGGAQPKEYLAKYAADRVRTIGTAWLGSTLACCECHDHKFDPFTTKDFYSLSAYFADIKQWGVYSYYKYTPTPELKGWSNDHPFPPEIEVQSPYLKQRAVYLKARYDALTTEGFRYAAKNKSGRKEFENWLKQSHALLTNHPDGWVSPVVKVEASNTARKKGKDKEKAAKLPDHTPAKNADVAESHVVSFSGKKTSEDRFEMPLTAGNYASLRLELIASGKENKSILRDKATETTIKFKAYLERKASKKREELKFEHGMADHQATTYSQGLPVLDVTRSWKVDGDHLDKNQTAAWQFNQPVHAEAGDTLIIDLQDNAISSLRWSLSPFASMDPLLPDLADSAAKADWSRRTKDIRLKELFLLSTQIDSSALAELHSTRDELLSCRDGLAYSLVTVAWDPATTRVLRRGNWQDEGGQVVLPHPPEFLDHSKKQDEQRQTRLDLARWLVSPDNPLTSRTIVNRLWKQLFGNGICNSVDDLGAQGEWPSHPELLDWLAIEFRESGWDYKHMVRLMVTSATYRQSSNLNPDALKIDPDNRLLASQNPRRLEAEFVRDNALFASGLINLDIGGPSVYPYQPEGYYASIQFPSRDYISETDDLQYRRGVYMHWQRTFLHPMLANFDAPSREDCIGQRVVSNTPQQALTLLNDPTFVEAARVLAQKVIESSHWDSRRLDLAFQRCLARSPNQQEKDSLLSLLKEQRKVYENSPEDAEKLLHTGIASQSDKIPPAEQAAWTSVCRVILNLHETITRY